ncbi:CBM 13 protein [Trichoderma simmonsii]|uniref:CBM 13 protein n=1 Tax=Trichoderma simmonsii TaxID=1491479 RepID=A0A8G0PFQ6_9HYPO|nr:CBM 13 protein [Trichoderma simmonsii]
MPLKDGIYIISSTLSGNPVLDIYQAANPFNGPINGVVGFTRQSTNNQHQQWVVTKLRQGVYSLGSVIGNAWITAPVDGSVAQLDTSVYNPVSNEGTRWKITNIQNDTYQIESVQFPGRVIDLEYASSDDNTAAILYPSQQSPNQIWKFIPIAI